MAIKLNVNTLKQEYVGKLFGYLTILDVFRRDSVLYFRCKCKCGTIKDITKKHILSGSIKSCGCYNKSSDKGSKTSSWFKNNPDKVKERNKKISQWYKDNPDKVKEKSEKFSKWCKEHPERVLEIQEKRLLFYKNHTGIVNEISEKYLQWCNDNKDTLLEIGRRHSQWFKDHPNEVAERNKKISKWYKDNPEKVKERSTRYTKWCKDNPVVLENRINLLHNKLSRVLKQRRLNVDFSSLIECVDPSYVELLLSGDLKSTDIIRTKCPICGEYDSHTLNNIFIMSRSEFKCNGIPLCFNCRHSLSFSKYEQEIADYISTFYNGECIRNSRDIISPLELDLYYPEKKIAIEFNGDYWHSDKFKDKDYHYSKFKACLNKHILLVSIFEHYWLNSKDDIKKYLSDTFAGADNKLSFCNGDYAMNNNYPSISKFKCHGMYNEDSYIYNNFHVITCGYTILE